MSTDSAEPSPSEEKPSGEEACPVCGASLLHEKCKVVCRSEICVYRIIYTCAEF